MNAILPLALYLASGATAPPGVTQSYRCEVVRVIDGDTFVARIDLGLDVSLVSHVRIQGLYAPEIRGKSRPAGERSREALRVLLAKGDILVAPTGQMTFGRVVAEVWASGIDVDAAMIGMGMGTRR